MIVDPSIARVAADLEQGDFLSGCDAGRWRIVSYEFPILNFAISATEPDGAASEYGFRAELSNYAAQAPMVRIWDHERNEPLDGERRPKGGPRVEKTFQCWGGRHSLPPLGSKDRSARQQRGRLSAPCVEPRAASCFHFRGPP